MKIKTPFQLLNTLKFPFFVLILFFITSHSTLLAQSVQGPGTLSLNISGGDKPEDLGVTLQLLFLMTLLTLAPSIIMLMTSFTRIVIVLGFTRNAVGVQSAPSNQIIIGLAVFLTFFLMGPIWEKIYETGISPYIKKEITSIEAMEKTSTYLKVFMLKQTREKDIEFFLGLSTEDFSQSNEELPMRIVVPAFVLSELRTAFQMGFMIFIPFLVIDFLIASTLMAMGMMMMPPQIIAMPFKILLFVLVDGWYLVVRSLVESFSL